MELTILPWHWIVFGFALIISEVFLATFFIIWFGAAAIIVGAIQYLFPELALMWQVLIWSLLSAALAIAWFKKFKPKTAEEMAITQQQIKGEVGLVLNPPVGDKNGMLRFPAPVFGRDEWQINSDDELAIGDRVTVKDISNNVLLVAKN